LLHDGVGLLLILSETFAKLPGSGVGLIVTLTRQELGVIILAHLQSFSKIIYNIKKEHRLRTKLLLKPKTQY
jgi:hypothetical protein